MFASLPDIVAEHIDEGSFLWLLRDLAAWAPHVDLHGLGEMDERLEAHLDAGRLAGELGWDLACDALELREPGETFVVAMLALESADPTRLIHVLESVSPDTVRGLAAALGWVSQAAAVAVLGELLRSPSPIIRGAGIAGAATHGQDPGFALAAGLEGESAALRERACDAVLRLRRTDLLPVLSSRLSDPDESVRFNAALGCSVLGQPKGLAALRRIAEAPGFHREAAARVAPRLMDRADAILWQKELTRDPTGGRAAVTAAGAVGDPALVPWLIEQMAVPRLARLAAESFRTITGVNLSGFHLRGLQPEGFMAGPSDDPAHEDVAPDPDDGLPWPDQASVARWWDTHGGRFHPRTRHLLGRSITPDALRAVLQDGCQRERAAAALEIAFRDPGERLFDVRAPASVQRRRLGLVR